MQTTGIPVVYQKGYTSFLKGRTCVKSQTYKGVASATNTSNPMASHKPDMWSLHQKLAVD